MRRRPITERFWEKVNVGSPDECWEWQAARNPKGYGVIAAGGSNRRSLLAARVMAAMRFGMFDQRLNVLHHCDNPPCVNPQHLYLGFQVDNVRDMVQRNRLWQTSITHCPKGHPYDEANTYMRNGARNCRECKRIKDRNRRKVRNDS